VRERHGHLAQELLGERAAALMPQLDPTFAELEELMDSAARAKGATPAERDTIAAAGELLSSQLVAAVLQHRGLDAAWVDARAVLVTDAQHGKAAPLFELTEARLRQRVAPFVADGKIVVMGGFVGATVDGKTTTLGRGGSDYSASIVGAGLGAQEIHIWTDVDGMLAADPRIVPQARLVPHLSFAEAAELAHFGAKVLHPSTILPALSRNIPVRILNARRPDAASTLITAHAPASETPLRALACKRDVTVVDITSTRMLMAHGFLRRVFEVFDRYETAVDVVTTSEVSVSVTIDDARSVEQIMADLAGFAEVSLEKGLAIVCAVGSRLRTDSALCGQVVSALDGLPLRMVSQAASRQNVTVVVAESDLRDAMGRLYQHFFEAPSGDGPRRMAAAARSSVNE
jgi:aspartate kinase